MRHMINTLINACAAADTFPLVDHHPSLMPGNRLLGANPEAIRDFAVIAFLMHYLPYGMFIIGPVDLKKLDMVPGIG
jgi:hypothetical protein